MGRATIVANKGGGLYTIDVDTGSTERAANIAKYQQIKQSAEENIPEIEESLSDAESKLSLLESSLSSIISVVASIQASGGDASAYDSQLASATAQKSTQRQVVENWRSILSQEESRLAEAIEKIDYYTNFAPILRVDAWCTELLEGLSGDCRTLEIDGTPDKIYIDAFYAGSMATDRLLSPKVMSASQAYANYAILDGWQKWKPTARLGTITSVDKGNDTANVTLDAATSHAQNLNINQSTNLSDVPIIYMGCNSEAFESGDRVVVRFRGLNWEDPVVCGFEDNPRPCGVWATFSDSWPNSFALESLNWLDYDFPFQDYTNLEAIISWSSFIRSDLLGNLGFNWDDNKVVTASFINQMTYLQSTTQMYVTYRNTPTLDRFVSGLKSTFAGEMATRITPLKLSESAKNAMEENPLSVSFDCVGYVGSSVDFSGEATFLGYYPIERVTKYEDIISSAFQDPPFLFYLDDFIDRTVGYIYHYKTNVCHGALIVVFQGIDNDWYAAQWICPKADANFRTRPSTTEQWYQYASIDTMGTFGADITMKYNGRQYGRAFKWRQNGPMVGATDHYTQAMTRGWVGGGKVQVDARSYPAGSFWLPIVEVVNL